MLKKEHENSKLARISQIVVEEFRRANVTYDQSRYVFKTARQALELRSERKRLIVPKALSEAQIGRFFASIDDPTDLLMFRLCYSCALRVSGLCDLKRDDLNLDDHTVRIRWNKTNSGTIPFPKSLRPLLKMHLAANSDCVWLFESNRHGRFSTRAIQLKFKAYVRKAGLPENTSVHSLRHSCLTHLASKGLQSSQLQAISLHKSKSSLDSYVRLSCVDVRDAYDQVMT
jgi:integrase/recombinase XerD